MSDTRSRFIYKVTTNVAAYIIIAHGEHDACGLINSRPETITVTKLGCVTADVYENGGGERGVVTREWLPNK